MWSPPEIGAFLVLSLGLLGGLLLFYSHIYPIHHDLAGILLTSRLADTLGDAFYDYSLYFPPADQAWFTVAVWLSDGTGLRLDHALIAMAGAAVLFSAGLAYHIRRVTVGTTPLFLVVSLAVLVILPVLFKNMFGMREHMVVLGLWPYLVLRLSDPDNNTIGWKTRALLGLWMGATLLLKYLYALVVLLVELVDAAIRRNPMGLFRIENLIAGAIVALYVFLWLIIDPSQREAIAVMASAIGANLDSPVENLRSAATYSSVAAMFLLLSYIFKLPLRVTLIGLALVAGAVAAAWIQSRWYTHHVFPITMIYVAWLWMISREVRLLWLIAVSALIVGPVAIELRSTTKYRVEVAELDKAMETAGISLEGKRVGLLTMHPSPFSQYLASEGATRWISSVNIAYVAAELEPFDLPENAGEPAPPITLQDEGRALLHDEMLRLWEDMPPDVIILDESASWPLEHIEVRWREVFAEDERFNAIMSQYRPVLHHEGRALDFTYLVRIEPNDP